MSKYSLVLACCVIEFCFMNSPVCSQVDTVDVYDKYLRRFGASLDVSLLDEDYWRHCSLSMHTTLNTDRYLTIMTFPIFVHDKFNDIENEWAASLSFAGLTSIAVGVMGRVAYEATGNDLFYRMFLGYNAITNASHHFFLFKPQYENDEWITGLRSVSIFIKNHSDYFPRRDTRWQHVSPGFGMGWHLDSFHILLGYNYNIYWSNAGREDKPFVYLSMDAYSWVLRLMAH